MKLEDKKGLHSSLFNRGQAHFYLHDYEQAISDFRKSMEMSKEDYLVNEKFRYIGMCYHYLDRFDSSDVYISRSYKYFKEDQRKILSILPFKILNDLKRNKNSSNKKLKEFSNIIAESDPYPEDYILTNWSMYNALLLMNKNSDASEFLENAYFELKARSKNIKDKKDRNKFLQAELHKDIATAWKEK